MRYTVERTRATDRDLATIFDFLIESYVSFGDDEYAASGRAAKRMRTIHAAMQLLAGAPHQGTLLPNLRPDLRSVTKDDAVFYFEVDDDRRTIRVLAILLSKQDHRRLMLKRLRGKH
jgi:plasmid stabilization system protein ParE